MRVLPRRPPTCRSKSTARRLKSWMWVEPRCQSRCFGTLNFESSMGSESFDPGDAVVSLQLFFPEMVCSRWFDHAFVVLSPSLNWGAPEPVSAIFASVDYLCSVHPIISSWWPLLYPIKRLLYATIIPMFGSNITTNYPTSVPKWSYRLPH